MSRISFPSEQTPSESGSSSHENNFYSSFVDAGASVNGFQMNPLSSHPPRTPRTSVISSSHVYATSVYDTKEEIQQEQEEDAQSVDSGDDQENERLKLAEKRIRHEDLWREMVLYSNGRDKAFKLIQYTLKVYLWFHTSLTTSRLFSGRTRPPWEKELVKRLSTAVSGFSFSRKTLLLFNWLQPITTIMAQQSVPFSAEESTSRKKQEVKPFLHTVLYAPPPVLLELANAISDDLYTLSLLGIFGKRFGERAARFSDWCWFLATLVGLVENGVERQMIGNLQHDVETRLYRESMSGATAKSKPTTSKLDDKELSRLQRQDYWLQITRAKLVMDLIFVSYDIFKFKRLREPVRAFSGLASAALSTMKLLDRHKTSLTKALVSSSH